MTLAVAAEGTEQKRAGTRQHSGSWTHSLGTWPQFTRDPSDCHPYDEQPLADVNGSELCPAGSAFNLSMIAL
jgi:hypothetical protein